jgi:hypothetical protein
MARGPKISRGDRKAFVDQCGRLARASDATDAFDAADSVGGVGGRTTPDNELGRRAWLAMDGHQHLASRALASTVLYQSKRRTKRPTGGCVTSNRTPRFRT